MLVSRINEMEIKESVMLSLWSDNNGNWMESYDKVFNF